MAIIELSFSKNLNKSLNKHFIKVNKLYKLIKYSQHYIFNILLKKYNCFFKLENQ